MEFLNDGRRRQDGWGVRPGGEKVDYVIDTRLLRQRHSPSVSVSASFAQFLCLVPNLSHNPPFSCLSFQPSASHPVAAWSLASDWVFEAVGCLNRQVAESLLSKLTARPGHGGSNSTVPR